MKKIFEKKVEKAWIFESFNIKNFVIDFVVFTGSW